MKNLLISQMLLGCLFSTVVFAEPEIKQKPIQCGTYKEVYGAYIEPNGLKPLFTGVANILRADNAKMIMPTVFYLNSETGQWLWIESNKVETCVINFGTNWDADVNEKELHSLLSSETT